MKQELPIVCVQLKEKGNEINEPNEIKVCELGQQRKQKKSRRKVYLKKEIVFTFVFRFLYFQVRKLFWKNRLVIL